MFRTITRPCLSQSLSLLLIGTALLTLSCASSGLKPGTGDVSFRLSWEGEADLDIHVEDPQGRHTSILAAISFQNTEESMAAAKAALELDMKNPADRGILDIDCNGTPDRMCPEPIENIYWPTGTAVAGQYQVWVHLFQRRYDGSQVPFVLEVRRGEFVVQKFNGTVNDEARESERFAYQFQR